MPLFERLHPGDHLCLTIHDDDTCRRSLTEVARAGLRQGHRVLYCGDGTGEALRELGAGGDLRVPPIESTYLSTGEFDPAAALCFLRREIDDARRAGYPGLRLLTDMSWASRPTPGIGALPEYEAVANTIFAEGYALAVCAYDSRLFGPGTRRGLTQSHLGAMTAGERFDPDSVLRVRRTREPFGLRLEGEADLLNRSALRAVLDHLLETRPSDEVAVLDLSRLRFIDTSAARILLVAHRRAAGRLRFLGRPAGLARLLEAHGTPGGCS
ncbi:MEDS domain-containing protein [Actinoplanes sp. CA-054009]